MTGAVGEGEARSSSLSKPCLQKMEIQIRASNQGSDLGKTRDAGAARQDLGWMLFTTAQMNGQFWGNTPSSLHFPTTIQTEVVQLRTSPIHLLVHRKEAAVAVRTMELQVGRVGSTLLPWHSTCEGSLASRPAGRWNQVDALHVVRLASLVERVPVGCPLFRSRSSSRCLRGNSAVRGSGGRGRRCIASRKRCGDTLTVLLLWRTSVREIRSQKEGSRRTW